MFSQTVEYALRAVVYMASRGAVPSTVKGVAEATRVPPAYLSKVMQSLARAGVMSSQRGVRGGFTLARKPSELTIWDVVDAVDPIPRLTRCPLGNENHGPELCPLHRRLADATAQLEASLRAATLEEMLNGRHDKESQCRGPASQPSEDS